MGEMPLALPVESADGHRWTLPAWLPQQPKARLLWLPALGVAARHYSAFAASLAARGVAVFVHEWRGHGSSSMRAGRRCDWGYRELLTLDLPAAHAAAAARLPDVHDSIVGGHSLGGQLASCWLALAPGGAQQLWLVASGAPYWKAFPYPARLGLPLAYRLLPWLADRCGALPGRRIGFGGREARGVMHDWAHSAITGRYAARGVAMDLDAALGAVDVAARAVRLQRDWLAPASSLDCLLAKMPRSRCARSLLDSAALGTAADHFSWMGKPDAVVDALLRPGG